MSQKIIRAKEIVVGDVIGYLDSKGCNEVGYIEKVKNNRIVCWGDKRRTWYIGTFDENQRVVKYIDEKV